MRIKRILSFTFRQLLKFVWLGLLLTSGCIRLERISTATPLPITTSTMQPTLALVTNTPEYGWTDVNYLMDDICFEAAINAAGQVYKIGDATTLEAFYSQIDRSQLCEDPVNHMTYPFNGGEVIVGLWSKGTGCSARYTIQNVQRDDIQKQEAIQLQFITEGDCPYELVQPFWIALAQSDGYTIQLDVQSMQ